MGWGVEGLVVNPAQGALLDAYLALLLRWNRVYNLTAIRDPQEARLHHLMDCLSVVAPMATRWSVRCSGVDDATGTAGAPSLTARDPAPARVLDVGSGGGLPGVVLAIMRPAWRVTCVDTVAKKASFVRQVAAELGLSNLESVHGRVEQLATPTQPRNGIAGRERDDGRPGVEGYDWITSRAFSSLADLVRLTRHLLAAQGEWAAMKAHLTAEESSALPPDIDMFHVEPLAVPGLDAQRCLVWMRPRPSR